MDRYRWLAPLTGIVFVALAVIGFGISGEPPDPGEGGEEITQFYLDNEGEVMLGAALEGIGATLFVFFGGVVRRALREAEGPRGTLSAISFAGAIIFAVGLALDGTISFALAEEADAIDPSAMQALQSLWNNDFLPFAVGIQLFALATGLSLVRHGALPKWLGWVMIVLAIIAVTPIGFAAFLGIGIVIMIISVLLARRERAVPASPTVAP